MAGEWNFLRADNQVSELFFNSWNDICFTFWEFKINPS